MMEELRNSPRYIKTFAEYIKSGDDEEIRALLTENVSGTIPVPELVYDAVRTAWTKDGIMNLVRKSYLKGNLKVGFEISSDGAVIHSEGSDPIDEESLVLGVVNLIPSNIKKYIAISDEVYDLAPEEFLTYVYSELTYQIAKKCGEELVTRIVSLSTQSNVPVVDNIESSITASTVAMALSKLCSEAQNPVIVMNKASWGEFKKAQYENKFRVDVFEGLPVVFNNALKPFNSATTGETFAIVGDFGNGALANYPNGEEIILKTDDISLAQQDLIKIIGRQYVAVDVVAPNHFTVINKGEGGGGTTPTGTIEITENTEPGSPLDIAQYRYADVNVSGGATGPLCIFNIHNTNTQEGTYYAGSSHITEDDFMYYHSEDGYFDYGGLNNVPIEPEGTITFYTVPLPLMLDETDPTTIISAISVKILDQTGSFTDLDNCTVVSDISSGFLTLKITDPSNPATATWNIELSR